jgi:3-oxoadipate enol-lactonase
MPRVRAAGHEIDYEVFGPRVPATPLLLLSGMGGACRGWLPLQVPDFAADHPTLIFDYRGVGASEDPGGAFSTADLADDAAALLDALGVERSHVLGAFMGGMVAQELALRHPERLSRLVLVGTYARPDGKRRMLLEKWRAMIHHGLPPEVLGRERLLWTLSDETLEQTDLIQPMLESYLHEPFPMSGDTFVRQCDACLGHDTSGRLGEIRARTLVIGGQQDNLTPPALLRQLADGLTDAHLVTLPSAAHLVMVEATKRFNQSVLQFLSDED